MCLIFAKYNTVLFILMVLPASLFRHSISLEIVVVNINIPNKISVLILNRILTLEIVLLMSMNRQINLDKVNGLYKIVSNSPILFVETCDR